MNLEDALHESVISHEEMIMEKLAYTIVCLVLLSLPALGQEKAKPDANSPEAAITKIARDYEAAYNKGDAKGLGTMFAEDVEYTAEDGGLISGRDAIVALLKKNFVKNPGAKMTIQINSIRSLAPDVAIERGQTLTTSRQGEKESSAYTAVHVRKNGAWHIQQLVESPVPDPSPGEMLSDLGWMVGTWTEKDGDAKIETKVNWAQGGNFLTRNFKVTVNEDVTMQGWQIIGWDPVQQKIRSWLFDTEGAFQEGTWTRADNGWTIRQTGYLPDGGTLASEHTFNRVNEDKCTWETTGRTLDGEPQPTLPRIEMIRAKGK
jgi:uncharacterized protein (TIGR02246 family)